MNKRIQFLSYPFFILSLLFCHCYAHITPVHTMQGVMEFFKEAGVDTLAIFDVDLVLIQPSEPAFQMANINQHKTIAKRIYLSLPLEKKDVFLTLMALNSASILIEDKTPACIHELKEKGIPVIALTASLTGSFAHIPNLESWKTDRLYHCGIDLSLGARFQETMLFDNLPSYRKNSCVYTNGILFANKCPKGDVLVSFLQRLNFTPKRIVFVDDMEENLINVEAALLRFDPSIRYEGLHYFGAIDFPSAPISEKEFEAKWQENAAQALLIE